MKYDRKSLRDTALSVKAAHEEAIRADYKRKVEAHDKAMKTWQATNKPALLAALQSALTASKKDQPIDLYAIRSMPCAPTPPGPLDCCTPSTKALDGLVEFLDTLQDGDITANALNVAGFKDMNRLLRRPC